MGTNNKKGFVIPLVIAIVAILIVGGAYYFSQKKQPPVMGCMNVVGGIVGVRNECSEISQCEYYKQINEKPFENDCYYGVATKNKDKTTCDLISTDWLKKACLDNIETPIPATTQPSITVLSPNGGETWKIGDQVTINWDAKNIPANNEIMISLYKGRQHLQVAKLPNKDFPKSYSWRVPETLSTTLGNDFELRIYSYLISPPGSGWESHVTETAKDSSDNYFTITN